MELTQIIIILVSGVLALLFALWVFNGHFKDREAREELNELAGFLADHIDFHLKQELKKYEKDSTPFQRKKTKPSRKTKK